MGTVTPAIGIYIPSAGETNYDQSWAAGMVNVDQHDHSGGPNKGLPIATEGLGAFSVTFDKLNINVVDPATGVGTSGVFPNQIVMLDPLKAIFQLAPADGFITMDGTGAHLRTFEDSTTVTWDNPDGTGGNPKAHVNIAGISPVTVPDGGTGLTLLDPYAVMAGGTTTTGNVQQVSGLGTAQQYLGSNGPGALPTWQTLPAAPTQNLQVATITLTDAQITAMNVSFPRITQQILAAPGAGIVIIPYQFYAKLNYGGTAFSGGSSVRLFYGTSGSAPEVGFNFTSGSFKDTNNAYYYAEDVRTSSSSGVSTTLWENRSLNICVNSSQFTSGAGNTITFYLTYSLMQI
jgi:hypothetical protein